MKKNLHFSVLLITIITLSISVNAQYYYDSVSFEIETNKIIIENSESNIWQIGAPQKTFFNSAYIGSNAIVTDTLSSYPTNDTSSFIYVIRYPYTETCYTSMQFWHKYDMDTLTDIGIIEASYDGGESWVLVADTNYVSPYGSFFWWDNDYHETSGNYSEHLMTTSGKSDGWVLSKFNWQWWFPVLRDTIIIFPDSLMIKFSFISDDIDANREGWLIDEILTTSAEAQLCSEIEEIESDLKLKVFPNPFNNYTNIEFNKNLNDVNICIYNSLGQKLREIEHISAKSIKFQRDNLPTGIYYLVVKHENELLFSEKLIIND